MSAQPSAQVLLLLLSSTHIVQHHGAIQRHSLCKAVHHVVYLAAEPAILIQVAQQLARCAAARRVLQVMQGLQDSPCHLLPHPCLVTAGKQQQDWLVPANDTVPRIALSPVTVQHMPIHTCKQCVNPLGRDWQFKAAARGM